MLGATIVRSNDFDIMAERILPFAARGETREKMKQLAEEYEERLSNLEGLLKGGRHSCPICESPVNVVITGNGRGDSKKYECRAWHDPDVTRRQGPYFRFSTYTSYEALKVYQNFLTEALSLLTLCEGTYEGISRYLNISKHMVELAVATLLDYLGEEGRNEEIEVEDDLVVIYSDFSGTRVSRAASVIMSRVGDSVAYQVCSAMNYLTAWNFVRALKERLVLKPGALVVFVTDGEKAWVDPIRSFFPGAVHIRQFHSESSRGIVYVHFPYGGKLYTLRCLWDAVLENGSPSEGVLRMRRRRKLEKPKSEKKQDRTELFDGVILWEGVVYEPRGVRRKKNGGATVSGAMEKEKNQGSVTASGSEPPDADGSGVEVSETFEKACRNDRHDGQSIAPATDGAKRIFKGSIEDAFQIPAVEYAYSILILIFGGLYITSNAVECLFNVKPGLRYHRTVKSGDALVHVLLYLRTQLRKKSRAEIKSFFRDMVSFERLRKVAVRSKGSMGLDREARTKQTVLDAYHNSEPVVISYQDARRRRTSRMIEPLGIEVDPYTGMLKIRAYCYLRDDERTFLMDRIGDAIPMDTNLSIVA